MWCSDEFSTGSVRTVGCSFSSGVSDAAISSEDDEYTPKLATDNWQLTTDSRRSHRLQRNCSQHHHRSYDCRPQHHGMPLRPRTIVWTPGECRIQGLSRNLGRTRTLLPL